MIPPTLSISQEALAEFCRRWKIAELAVFGSALRQEFPAGSDVDVLVTFADGADWSLFEHVRMQQELKALLNREVDLVSRRAVERSKNWIRRRAILNTAQAIYVTG